MKEIKVNKMMEVLKRGLQFAVAVSMLLSLLLPASLAGAQGTTCYNVIANSGFEYTGSWVLGSGNYPPQYTVEQFHAGNQSVYLGTSSPANPVPSPTPTSTAPYPAPAIANSVAPRYVSSVPASGDHKVYMPIILKRGAVIGSFGNNSYLYQELTIPADATSATLTFWYWAHNNDKYGINKQECLVLHGDGFGEVDSIWTVTSNAQSWQQSPSFDLLDYRGQTIRLQFNVENHVYEARTGMYLDDVELQTCGESASPTPYTPTSTPLAPSPTTAAPTPTSLAPSPTPVTPAPTPIPDSYIINPGFEETGGWQNDCAVPAVTVNNPRHQGAYAMRLGIDDYTADMQGVSCIYQDVHIPSGAQAATLSFYYYPWSNDIYPWDWQTVELRDTAGNTLADVLPPMIENTRKWTSHTYDLTAWRGNDVRLYFAVYNNGIGGAVSAMYVDDVELEIVLP